MYKQAHDQAKEIGRRIRIGNTHIRPFSRPVDDGVNSNPPISPSNAWKNHLPHLRGTSADGLAESNVSRYEIRRSIGHGGFGEVFEAYDTVDGELVAVKRVQWATLFNLRKDKVAHRELEMLRTFEHPYIVVYKDAFVDNGLYSSDLLLVMELCDRDLYSVVHYGQVKLDTATAIHYMACISSAIQYLHGEQVIHRDLKPQNVLMTKDGVPKVTDFGLACFAGAEAEKQNKMRRTIAGTPQYTAPELISGVYDETVDIWGLGCIFYELVTRRFFDRSRALSGMLAVHPKLRGQLALMLSETPGHRPTARQCHDFFVSTSDLGGDGEDASAYWTVAAALLIVYVLYFLFF